MLGFTARVTVTGPLADGQLGRQLERGLVEALDEVANQGQADVHQLLDASIRNPTPYYETQITVDRSSAEQRTVHDQGVIYGPWLEGVSSRNFSTRFKGYHSFRRAALALQAKVPGLTDPIFKRITGG